MIKRQQGFTLVEMIIAIVITAVVMIGASRLLVQGFRGYYLGRDAVNTDWQARVAMERMTRDLRAIRSSNDIIVANTNSIRFVDISGNDILYQVSGSQLTRTLAGSSADVLADNIVSLNFNYYNSSGVSTTIISAIRYIVPSLVVTYTSSNLPDYIITAGVYPWNLN